nr:hypothetical protein [uncultured Cohaesibacter sp.]
MSDIEQATSIVAAGQADVVFVDESYGPEHIAKMLIPARQVEFSGGRGVCLILCSKKATAQDVINARKLGIASLVILPTSIDTVRKHLELAARFVPQSDEELGWSKPREKAPVPALKSQANPPEDAASAEALSKSFAVKRIRSQNTGADETEETTSNAKAPSANTTAIEQMSAMQTAMKQLNAQDAPNSVAIRENGTTPDHPSSLAENIATSALPLTNEAGNGALTDGPDPFLSNHFDIDMSTLSTPGRSGRSAEEEVVFL